MNWLETAVPAKYRKKFTRAVAAKRVLNEKGRKATIAQANSYYKAINDLPAWLQPIANKRAER